jgi:hypothetical protein
VHFGNQLCEGDAACRMNHARYCRMAMMKAACANITPMRPHD